MQDNRRYYSLDALRGIMMMLGIVLHASQWYVTEPPGGLPMPLDDSRSYLFDIIMHFIHSFRMPLFFVLAGFFTSLLVGKRSFRGTYINRLQRILVPLLLAIVTILPLTLVFMVSFMASARFGTQQFLITESQLKIISTEMNAAGMPTDQPSLGHLWFLYYLLYFYLLIPLCFIVSRWTTKLNLGRIVTSPLFCALLGAYTVFTLWFFRGGVLFEGFIFIKPHPPSLLYYGSFFFLGYLFHSHRGILETFHRSDPAVSWPGGDRQCISHLGSDLLLYGAVFKVPRLPVPVDTLCVKLILLGLPAAYAGCLLYCLVSSTTGIASAHQVSHHCGLYGRCVFCELPLPRTELLVGCDPERQEVQFSVALAGKTQIAAALTSLGQ